MSFFFFFFPSSFGSAKPDATKPDPGPYETFVQTLLVAWPFLPFSADPSANEFDRLADLAIRTARETLLREPETAKISTPKLIARLSSIVKLVCARYPEDLVVTGTGRDSEWKIVMERMIKEMETIRLDDAQREGEGVQVDLEELLRSTVEELRRPSSVGFTEWTTDRSTSTSISGGVPVGRLSTKTGLSKSSSSTSIASTHGSAKRRGSQDSDLGQTTPLSLSSSTFLNLDPGAFAIQIHLFHLDRLRAISPNQPTRHMLRAASTLLSLSLDPASKHIPLTPLFSFSPQKPHCLTRILLDTLLTPSRASPAASVLNLTSITLQLRVAVLTRWIIIGEELRRRGDAVGWMAIAMGTCSRAVARLEDTWRLLPHEFTHIVRLEWAPILVRVGYSHLDYTSLDPVSFEAAQEGTAVPFFGSILEESMNALKAASAPVWEHVGAVDLQPLYHLREKFIRVEELWVKNLMTPEGGTTDRELQFFLQTISRATPHCSVAPLSSYLSLSLEVEPRLASELLHHIPSRSTIHPLVPLIFVEPLPHINLGQRETILASISGSTISHKQSTSSLSNAAAELQQRVPVPSAATRLGRHNSYPPSSANTASEKIGIFSRLRQEIADSSDTLLRFADGGIVFRIVSSALPSIRAPVFPAERNGGLLSRNSSWIESKSMRRSMKSARTSIHSTGENFLRTSWAPSANEESPSSSRLFAARDEEPVYVVVKEGTVESLVDLLVLGTDNLRAPSTDADGESSLTQRRPLFLDMEEYRSTFFATFKSFMPPVVLMDLLRKRYLAAPNASREKVTLSSSKPFPSWSLAPVTAESEHLLDWEGTNRIRLTLLEGVQYWSSHHLADFLDDDELFVSCGAFLALVEANEREASGERLDHDDRVLALVGTIKARLAKDALRPALRPRKAAASSMEDSAESLSFDSLTINQLVDRLDAVACEAFRDVTGLFFRPAESHL